MALAYTAPTWTDGSGEGISASNLQAISDCIEGLVQGSDKAVHAVQINGSIITLTYADGTSEDFNAVDIKGIASIEQTSKVGRTATYTITYSDGTTSTFQVLDGEAGTYPILSATASADALSSQTPSVTVTKTGTDAAPNFDFAFSGLKGAQGDTGATGADGQDGYSPEVTISTITGGHRVTITDKDHPTGQSFDVMDGSGAGDMEKSVYDSDNAVATAGGIASYVSGQLPTVNDAVLSIQRNSQGVSTFTANASSNVTCNIEVDSWKQTNPPTVVSSGAFSFTLNDTHGYGFKPFIEVDDNSTNKNPKAEISSISGAGTASMVVTYTTDADEGSEVKMRIYK